MRENSGRTTSIVSFTIISAVHALAAFWQPLDDVPASKCQQLASRRSGWRSLDFFLEIVAVPLYQKHEQSIKKNAA